MVKAARPVPKSTAGGIVDPARKINTEKTEEENQYHAMPNTKGERRRRKQGRGKLQEKLDDGREQKEGSSSRGLKGGGNDKERKQRNQRGEIKGGTWYDRRSTTGGLSIKREGKKRVLNPPSKKLGDYQPRRGEAS